MLRYGGGMVGGEGNRRVREEEWREREVLYRGRGGVEIGVSIELRSSFKY